MVSKVIKRDGTTEGFDEKKIESAIRKAFNAVGEENGAKCRDLAKKVTARIDEETVSVEEIQDIVERTLLDEGFSKVAKAYIIYRRERSRIREEKAILGVKDDLKLSVNAIRVLRKRYLLRNDERQVLESPKELLDRVAKHVAKNGEERERFFSAMKGLYFLPNSPTLMNAGTPLGQLSACFVLPVEDSIEGIFTSLKHMAIIHKSGGGTGFSFTHLRPRGDVVGTTKGVASGPVSFMRIYDIATDVIKQGGKRRGANMGILNADHPDILSFINSKVDGSLRNFNISVGVNDPLFERKEIELINPRNDEVVSSMATEDLFSQICYLAWRTGDPGMLYLDEINRRNPTPELGRIEATNPCGEVPLLPYESCNLGSINLSRFVENREVQWDRLREITDLGVRFLDNVIDANSYPLGEIEAMTKGNRKIGLGVMGFAEMLIKLGIPYDSEEALSFAEKLMKFINDEARKVSEALGSERGAFPNIDESIYKGTTMRNATRTSIAPTGSISTIAGTSSGIEPIFAIAYVRNVLEGERLVEVNPLFIDELRRRDIYSPELMNRITRTGNIKDTELPAELKELYVTALEIEPEWHVRMQAAFQKHVDNAVSKTVNLPREATVEDVKRIYRLAHELKCKGITVFRQGSKEGVLSEGGISEEDLAECQTDNCYL
jgi:ribonucleoside-diphosphate reductase alpha chain